jgi:DNA-binding MarR family transcriptional regulator
MSVSPTLTGAQLRVLRFCAGWPHWLSLLELSIALPPDAVVTVPSLVERGLLEREANLRTVRATEAGRRLVATYGPPQAV